MDQHRPSPLFHQCIQFIAENVEIVESFMGFPSQIGELIFKQCLEKKKFMTGNLTSLALFASEFGSELLKTLTLSGQYLCLNYYLENLLLFTDLTELDVSCCGLGDKHELLTHFAQLHRLELLNLSGNCISDSGIQRMTTPFRMLNKGPSNLAMLDIAGNSAVSLKCLKYLSPFKRLTVILPGKLPEKSSDYKNWKFTNKDKLSYKKAVVTQGWASELIEGWKAEVKKRQLIVKPRKQTFYKRSICPSEVRVDVNDFKDSECIMAINQIEEMKKEHIYPVINKQGRVSQTQTVQDEESLLAMYKIQPQDSIDDHTVSYSALDNLDKLKSHPVKTSLDKFSQIRMKSNNYHGNKDSLFKPANISASKNRTKEERTIHQYFTPKSHKSFTDEATLKPIKRSSSVLEDNINSSLINDQKFKFSLTKDKDRGNALLKDIELSKDKGLSKSALTGHLNAEKGDSKVNTLNRKRKRIVISRPLAEKSLDEETNRSIKYPKTDPLNVTSMSLVTDYRGKQKLNQCDVKTSSFLDSLDSFI